MNKMENHIYIYIYNYVYIASFFPNWNICCPLYSGVCLLKLIINKLFYLKAVMECPCASIVFYSNNTSHVIYTVCVNYNPIGEAQLHF